MKFTCECGRKMIKLIGQDITGDNATVVTSYYCTECDRYLLASIQHTTTTAPQAEPEVAPSLPCKLCGYYSLGFDTKANDMRCSYCGNLQSEEAPQEGKKTFAQKIEEHKYGGTDWRKIRNIKPLKFMPKPTEPEEKNMDDYYDPETRTYVIPKEDIEPEESEVEVEVKKAREFNILQIEINQTISDRLDELDVALNRMAKEIKLRKEKR